MSVRAAPGSCRSLALPVTEEMDPGSSLPQKGLPYTLQRKVWVTEVATPGPDHRISLHRCLKQKTCLQVLLYLVLL